MLEAALAIDAKHRRAEALAILVPRLPEAKRAGALEAALEAAQDIYYEG